MSKILIVTSPILGKIDIQKYLGTLTGHVVLGVNFFSDFAASVTDILGGTSDTYQSKLETITSEVNKIMQSKATTIGANAIIDYKLQFNEISGKGKQMFMVTATGTACIITTPKEEILEGINHVPYTQILRQSLITIYRDKLRTHDFITDKDWEKILSLNISELAPDLANEYFRLKSENGYVEYVDMFSFKFEEYLNILNKTEASKTILFHIDTHPELVVDLAIKYNLFNPDVVLSQISSGKIAIAINLLRSHKDYYSREDLVVMKKIISLLKSLSDKGSFQIVKNGLFSKKEEQMYICPNGHKNTNKTKYCTNCGLDIKGLTLDQNITLERFMNLTEALSNIFEK